MEFIHIIYYYNISNPISKFLISTHNLFNDGLNHFFSMISDSFISFVNTMSKNIYDPLISTFKSIWNDTITYIIDNIWNPITNFFITSWDAITLPIHNFMMKYIYDTTYINHIFKQITQPFIDIWSYLTTMMWYFRDCLNDFVVIPITTLINSSYDAMIQYVVTPLHNAFQYFFQDIIMQSIDTNRIFYGFMDSMISCIDHGFKYFIKDIMTDTIWIPISQFLWIGLLYV